MPNGLQEWERSDGTLKEALLTAYGSYKRSPSLDALQGYERAVRAYLDHGFVLYRTYRAAHKDLPSNLLSSLQQRAGLLMDVADEYIEHGSLAIGEAIAVDVIHHYSDLPVLAPAQRRAEGVLLRYRYREDY
jgi:hypothetical protein